MSIYASEKGKIINGGLLVGEKDITLSASSILNQGHIETQYILNSLGPIRNDPKGMIKTKTLSNTSHVLKENRGIVNLLGSLLLKKRKEVLKVR